MLYAGLDLSRKRTPPDVDGLHRLSQRVARHGAPVRAAIESMNGARFVHDRLEMAGRSRSPTRKR
jgi:transposase